ncbi:MAG: response regulator [Spirochaetaceae bacterium]|nr:response regulator [Spirochaetaceae bacterium]
MDNIKKNSVLIVDDEKSNIEVLIHILSPEYNVYMTKSGSVAIEMANKFLPDIILLDIVMPDMDGFEVLAALKLSARTRHIPVIFITGLDSVEDEEKGLDLDAVDYIHKPFSAKIVKSRVRNQIQIVNQIRELVTLHQDLEAAVKAAESANQTKSAFLAKMSHEIRTPLNAVLGISEIHLQKESLPQDIKEAFSRIFTSGDLLLGIINDILDMSKIEAQKLELSPTQYDVSSMIYDTAFFNMIKYENKPIEFILNVDENVPSALIGDELRIKQVLNNLLSNAFKYTKAGKVELLVTAKDALEKSGENSNTTVTLVLSVRDTGQGMTQEQLSKLFDEYSRFNMEANRSTEGTGLGMSITQNLIRMMDGRILVESEPGEGTLVTVRLPQGNVGAVALGKEAVEKLRQFRTSYEAKVKKAPLVSEPMPFGRVLLVDDMDMNLYVAEDMLSPYGLQVDKATSGAEAIEKVKSNEYDLVLMDHMMPVMDGIETTQEIRKLGQEYEKLPIVALTANAVSGAKEMFLANGFNGFISKPISMQKLDEVLKEWILSKGIKKSDEAAPSESPSSPQEAEDVSQEDYDSFLDNVAKIDEINIEIGLTQFSNTKDMYCNTLDMFHKKFILKCDDITALFEAKDLKNFYISMHGIKSSLFIIGAVKLSEMAADMEIASKNGALDFCEKKFPEFKERLLLLCKQLSVVFSGVDFFSEN